MDKTKNHLNYRLCSTKFTLFLLVMSYQTSCYSYSLSEDIGYSLYENSSRFFIPNFQKLLLSISSQLSTSYSAYSVYSHPYLVTLITFAIICQERLRQNLVQFPLLLNSGKHGKVAFDYQLTVLQLFFLNNQCNFLVICLASMIVVSPSNR